MQGRRGIKSNEYNYFGLGSLIRLLMMQPFSLFRHSSFIRQLRVVLEYKSALHIKRTAGDIKGLTILTKTGFKMIFEKSADFAKIM